MSRRSAAKSTAQLQTDSNPDNMDATWDNTATTHGVWTQTVALAVAAFNDAFDTLVVKDRWELRSSARTGTATTKA